MGAQDLQRDAARALDRDAVGDRQRRLGLDRRPACIDSGYGAHAAAWTPMIFTSGLASLITSAMPGAQPAAADRHDHLRQIGDVLEQFEPERALAGDDRRVVERVHERQPALLARVRARRPGRRRRCCRRRGRSPRRRAPPRPSPSARRWARTPRRDAAGGRARRRAPARGCRRWRRRRRWRSLLAERGELRGHAADLERAGALQVLGLQHDRPTRALGERAGGQDRRPARDGLDRRACGFDVARGDAVTTR